MGGKVLQERIMLSVIQMLAGIKSLARNFFKCTSRMVVELVVGLGVTEYEV